MPDFLLELFSEEIPARMQSKAAETLKKNVTNGLVDSGLLYEGARPYWTPRRLVLYIRGLTASSKETTIEKKGPRINADQKTIDGFLRSAGLNSITEATICKDVKKGDFYGVSLKKTRAFGRRYPCRSYS